MHRPTLFIALIALLSCLPLRAQTDGETYYERTDIIDLRFTALCAQAVADRKDAEELIGGIAACGGESESPIVFTLFVSEKGALTRFEMLRCPDRLIERIVSDAVKSASPPRSWLLRTLSFCGEEPAYEGKVSGYRYLVSLRWSRILATAKAILAGRAMPAGERGREMQPGENDGGYMPRFMGGGIEEFRRWLTANLRYPENFKRHAEMDVSVSFVVERDGRLGKIKVMNIPDVEYLREVMAVLDRCPAWEPGLDSLGRPLRVKYTVPVKFRRQ